MFKNVSYKQLMSTIPFDGVHWSSCYRTEDKNKGSGDAEGGAKLAKSF